MQPIEEQWRPVVGHEAVYEVSNLGRVRSKDRSITVVNGRTAYQSFRKGRILKPGTSLSGHKYVIVASAATTVHSIVAAAFIGPRPDGMETRHLNGDPSDNRPENLAYGTRSEKAEDSKRHGTHFYAGITVCKRGHDLTDQANLQKTAKGSARRICLACRRERQRLYDAGKQVTMDGFCINGHPKTAENRYTNGVGNTRCKPCAIQKKKG